MLLAFLIVLLLFDLLPPTSRIQILILIMVPRPFLCNGGVNQNLGILPYRITDPPTVLRQRVHNSGRAGRDLMLPDPPRKNLRSPFLFMRLHVPPPSKAGLLLGLPHRTCPPPLRTLRGGPRRIVIPLVPLMIPPTMTLHLLPLFNHEDQAVLCQMPQAEAYPNL